MFFHHHRLVVFVEGMHCKGCAERIENTLTELTDVLRVRVNLGKKEVIVIYDNTLDGELIQKKVEELGYTVTGIKNIR